jgi:hypothetical protein
LIPLSSWPGIAVRRTASLPLAYVPAIYVFLPHGTKDVDAWHKAVHDEFKRRAVHASLFTAVEVLGGTYLVTGIG